MTCSNVEKAVDCLGEPIKTFSHLSCREYKIENLFRGQEEGERDTYPGRYLVTNIVCTVMKQQHDDRSVL